jgi:hypothetical protein
MFFGDQQKMLKEDEGNIVGDQNDSRTFPSILGDQIFGFSHGTPWYPLPINFFHMNYTGWWLTYPSEKYESQLGLLFPIYGEQNVPNHQAV